MGQASRNQSYHGASVFSTGPRMPVENVLMTTFVAVFVLLLAYFYRIKAYREEVMRRNGNLPRVAWNKWFGTIPAMVDLYKEVPAKAHPQTQMTVLYRKHNLDNVWFLEAWPAMREPQIVIADPDVAAQVTQLKVLPKHYQLRKFTEHLAGPQSLLYSEGEFWKKTRSMFNPGFALAHLMTLVPSMVNDAINFRNNLANAASAGEMIFLEELAAMFAFDVMGHVVLDHDLNSQLGPNDLVDSFRSVVQWTPEATNVNPFTNFNPSRLIAYKYYGWKMNRYIGKILDDRFTNRSGKYLSAGKSRRKPGIDLALDEYAKQEAEAGETTVRGLDPRFKALAIDSMRSFLFAGQDSTSTTITFIFHCLSKHPEAKAKVRQELDEILGKDIDDVADVLKSSPALVNKLVYLNAVIKETLRLYPPASSIRAGHPFIDFTYKGVTYPTKDSMVWVVSHTMHRRTDLFPEPDSFIPERFLPADDPNRYQEIPKDAWRPFEKGARNCIGQELAMLEIKIAVALTVREFDVENAYKENDRRLGRPNPGGIEGGTRGMFGDRAWQILQASAKPHDSYPAFVMQRNPGAAR